jgi:hypothetical protein
METIEKTVGSIKKGGCRGSHTLDKEVGGRVCPGNVGHSELPSIDFVLIRRFVIPRR